MNNLRVFAILPAGGCGQRTQLPTPKQFCDVLGRPLIVHTLECFQSLTWIEKIVVAVAPDWEEFLKELIERYQLSRVEIVEGGTSRHRSIKSCVEYLGKHVFSNCDQSTLVDEREAVVIVHDAVRPFADGDILRRVTLAAKDHGAAGAVLPLVSTIIESDSQDVLVQSLVRSKFKESHTPQAFTWPVLRTAYKMISEHSLDYGTEVLDLALMHTGCRAKLVEAPDHVWKVTYKKDLVTAESFAKVNNSYVYIESKEPQNVMSTQLKKYLISHNLKVSQVSSVPSVLPVAHVTLILHFDKISGEEFRMECEQSITTLTSTGNHGGTLACLCHISKDCVDVKLQEYRRLVKRLASYGTPGGVYVYVIVYISTPKQEKQLIPRVCEMAASLVYDRNPLMSGQLFFVSEDD